MTFQATLKSNKTVAKAQALARLDVDDLLKRPLEQRRQGFQPGRSGNPGGRVRGTLNNRVNPLRKLLMREGLPVLRKVIEMAKAGDVGVGAYCRGSNTPKGTSYYAGSAENHRRGLGVVGIGAVVRPLRAGQNDGKRGV